MDTTNLLYLSDFNLLSTDALITSIFDQDGRRVLLLDKTVFYPQGGGQPYDKGTISKDGSLFHVQEVRFFDGQVHHIGEMETGEMHERDTVSCRVDQERRLLNSRLHSAGHVVDVAVTRLGLPWIPAKAYHFPEGAYVEYEGSIDEGDKERLKQEIETMCKQVVAEDMKVSIRFMDKDEMGAVCHFVPENIPTNKPSRVILFGDFGIPCGGTHVNHLSELKEVTIRKIKMEKGFVRVGYDIPR